MKFSSNPVMLERFDGTVTRSPNRMPLSDVGVDGTWYGGHLKVAAQVDGTHFIMLLGENNKTIAVAIHDEDIPKLTAEERVMFRIKDEAPKELDESKQLPITEAPKATATVQFAKVNNSHKQQPLRPVHKKK